MAVFKCKMCGGSLEIKEGLTVVECEYCMTKQTLPRLDDDKKANLYDRAGHFRRNNEFDKAIGVYEKILDEDNTDAEAYWSLVLCKYGIEYVEDPATHKRVPTVNRAQFTSVFADEDYKSAIQYADSVQKAIYEEEARTIDEIQKGILAISEKEEPFDVFICYKETDNNGRRTPDSVLANDLYHQLTQEGYKVFFAKITLEDKLGTAYEPYIFAALNSAKVMVVLGTKPEYFNAVWVKNEWSRYLALIKNGGKKILIPAYKDMDPYDLPEEFSHLQAQDMSKLGFMQDLIRGIKKITAKDEPKQVVQERVVVNNAPNADVKNLLNRAFLFLEDGDWETAEEYCEKVLDIDFQCAEAYLGKLMSDLEVHKRENLRYCKKPFDNEDDYKKIMRFGDEAIKREMTEYIEFIKTAELDRAYQHAIDLMNSRHGGEDTFIAAIDAFNKLDGYKDSHEMIRLCRVKAEEARKDSIYNEAVNLINSKPSKAIELFDTIRAWKDSEQKIEECHKKIEEIRAKAEADRIEQERKAEEDRIERERIAAEEARIAEKQRIERERIAEIERKEKARRAKRNIIIASIVGAIAVLSVAGVFVFINVISPMMKYNDAVALVESGKYNDAIIAFTELGDYKDSEQQIENCRICILDNTYNSALSLMNDGKYSDAIEMFTSLGDYKDSAIQIEIAENERLRTIRENLPSCTIAASRINSFGVKSDGTVVTEGKNDYGQCLVYDWTDIVAVSAGDYHTIGLKKDGTVIATGSNDASQCNVVAWTDIIAVSAGIDYTVALKSDGTVVAVGNNDCGQCDVNDWTDIIAISAGYNHTVGLKSDGTVIATGNNSDGQCEVTEWIDIVAISAGKTHTVGLKSNGTVVDVGDGPSGASSWTNIIAIAAGEYITVGLTSDGTVESAARHPKYNGGEQSDVHRWTDIIAIEVGNKHTLGLKSNGIVCVVGDGRFYSSNLTEIKTTN